MVFFPTMIKGVNTNAKCKQYHKGFEVEVLNNIDPEDGQAGKH